MAPEMANGNSTWTTRCDVFSLGCTVYELAAYEPASPGQITDQQDMPFYLPDEYSPKLWDLVERCMAFNSADRPEMSEILAQATELQGQTEANRQETNGNEVTRITTLSNPAQPKNQNDGLAGQHTNGDMAVPQKNVLHWAAIEGDEKAIELTRLLLSILEDVNISSFVNEPDAEGYTPLWHAIENGRTVMAGILLDNEAKFDTDGRGGVTALIKSVEYGHVSVVERLVNLPDCVNVNGVDDHGKSALHRAAAGGYVRIATLLLDKGADVDAPDANGCTALREACDSIHTNWKEMVDLLLDRGVKVEDADDEGRTVLHSTMLKENTEPLAFLLRRIKGADVVDMVDEEERTPLHVAAASGRSSSVRLLVEAGADCEANDRTSRTPLHITVDDAPPDAVLEIVNILLAKGADINKRDANGFAALYKAVDRSLELVAERLLQSEELVITEEHSNRSSILHMAVSRGLRSIVPLLIERGASITSKNERGQTPLHEAFKRASRLTQANRRYKNWIGLLMGPSGNTEVLESQDEDGNTPLHMAVLHKAKSDLIELLIKTFPGAMSMCNKTGLVPYLCLETRHAAQSSGDSDTRAAEIDQKPFARHSLVRANVLLAPHEGHKVEDNRRPTKADDMEIVRDVLRYHYVRNSSGQLGTYTNHQERRIAFDLSAMRKPVTEELLRSLENQMTFEPILKYVFLSSEAIQVAYDQEPTARRPEPSLKLPAALVFRWLRERKHVQRILEVRVIDNGKTRETEETIKDALNGNFGIEVWDWKHVDISSDTLVKVAPNAQVVRLYSSGNANVLHAWSGKHGLARLQKLQKVEVTVELPGPRRPGNIEDQPCDILESFKQRLLRRLPTVQVSWNLHHNQAVQPLGLMRRVVRHGWLQAMKSFTRLVYGLEEASFGARTPQLRIAIIDDGVDLTNSDGQRVNIADGKSFSRDERHGLVEEYFVCPSGHGTSMASLIRRLCPFAQFYVAKLPHDSTSRLLAGTMQAVEWAIKKNVDIIYICCIMSAGRHSHDERLVAQLESAIQKADAQGIVIICKTEDPHLPDGQATTDDYDADYYESGTSRPGQPQRPFSLTEPIRIGAVRPGEGLQSFQDGNLDYTFPGDKVLSGAMGADALPGASIAVGMAVGLAGLTIASTRLLRDRSDSNTRMPDHWPSAIRGAFDNCVKDWKRVLGEIDRQVWDHRNMPEDVALERVVSQLLESQKPGINHGRHPGRALSH
ncbi:ankyrin repeat-containing domain protein [Triangularia verruculosa]|uniref:Ankyrin repeat-containing domain protein n=1 Tax=Triangularia verruculosa TaxID=2587418 RepID=A0AAN6XSG9_9PEZI|nr:ankyrin repeat-containing domain protein [Triangularia verruculosa]